MVITIGNLIIWLIIAALVGFVGELLPAWRLCAQATPVLVVIPCPFKTVEGLSRRQSMYKMWF